MATIQASFANAAEFFNSLLVVSAADAGPALECLGDPTLIFRYGLFYFERSADGPPVEYDTPGFKTFAEALMAAVNAVAPKELKLGVDGRGGADLKTLLGAARPIVDISDEIVRSRATKLPGELVRLRRATQLVEAGIDAIRREFKVGMSEWELAGLPRSALADAYPTARKIQAGDIIRLDASCVVDGYKSDMARSFVVGEASKLVTARYKAIAEGLVEELAAVRSGAKVRDVHLAAVNATRSAGIPS
ncbi:Metallopeptidase family M24 [Bradyrhizobium shewense]|uniref:Metallopeptidase family M24 n=1 Tax=Bradyrhizobium shewense TaxID=1761772 RepID=A0A1C3XTV0_9BRAD|nr:Metallopeptidase family M24 [Bradyrhizobium shewense]